MKNKNSPILNPYYVTGFSDGESCFHVSVGKSSKYKSGFYVNPGFKIGLHKKDQRLLELIQSFWGGIGNITKQKDNAVQYRVLSIKDLAVIINHFDQYPLISQKQTDYILFKQICELIKNKEHLTLEGFEKIVTLKASMNLGLSEVLKAAFPNTIAISNPKVITSKTRDPNGLAGYFWRVKGAFLLKFQKVV